MHFDRPTREMELRLEINVFFVLIKIMVMNCSRIFNSAGHAFSVHDKHIPVQLTFIAQKQQNKNTTNRKHGEKKSLLRACLFDIPRDTQFMQPTGIYQTRKYGISIKCELIY